MRYTDNAPLLSPDEMADSLKISLRTLQRRRDQGLILAPIQTGGHPRWRRKEVLDWIDAGCPPESEWNWLPQQGRGAE